jgi:16S rRNA (guanine966-N2)-methyltransferase
MPIHRTMRITGGGLVRRRFLVPPLVDKGVVRPTPDRVREAVFSMIGPYLSGAIVLDLFAGSGAHGFEAISRGAKSVRFIEKDPRVASVIRENIKNLDLSAQCTVEIADALQMIELSLSDRANIIFVDPPYALRLGEDFFKALSKHVADEGLVIFRCFKKEVPHIDEGWHVFRDRQYGSSRVFILQRALT